MSHRSTILADSPIGYFRHGESSGTDGVDEVGTYAGVYSGDFTLGQTSLLTGDADTCVAFGGTNGKMTVAGINTALGGAAHATLEAIFSRSSTGNSVAMGCSASSTGRFSLLWLTDGNLYFSVSNGGAAYAFCALSGTGKHHILATYDGTQSTNAAKLKVYVDGAEQPLTFSGTIPATLAASGSIGGFEIGHEGANIVYSTGKVDETAVYATTLSASRAQAHYISYVNATMPVSPASCGASAVNVVVTLTGSGFTPGSPGSPTFTASSGTILSQTVLSSTTATLNFTAPASGAVLFTDPNSGDQGALPIAAGVTLDTYGDSYTSGQGASDAAHRYANLTASGLYLSLSNHGVASSQAADSGQAGTIYATAIAASASSTWLTGFNDARSYGSSSASRDDYMKCMAAIVAWLAVPDTSKIRHDNGGVAYTGTWSTSSNLGGLHLTSTNGDYAEFTATGTNVLVCLGRAVSAGGLAGIKVDGVEVATLNTDMTAATVAGRDYQPALVHLTGLSSGSHTIRVTAKQAGTVHFIWAFGITPGGALGPVVRVGLCPSAPVEADTNFVAYRAAQLPILTALSDAGLTVLVCDPSLTLDLGTDFDVDDVHPNDLGHAKIATAFEGATAPDTTAPTVTGTPTIATNGTTLTATLSESGCNPTSGTLGFTVYNGAAPASVTGWAISGTTLTITLGTAISAGATVQLDHVYEGMSGSGIVDAAGNPLADFAGMAVTNNSTVAVPTGSGLDRAGIIAVTAAGETVIDGGRGLVFIPGRTGPASDYDTTAPPSPITTFPNGRWSALGMRPQ